MLCLASPLTLPVGPVPVSLFSGVLMLVGGLIGARRGFAACGVYLLLGMLGLSVFSGFAGDLGHLVGPTGGFLLGCLPLVAIAGAAFCRTKRFALQVSALSAGTLLLYAVGTAWYTLQTGASVEVAVTVCVLPFLLGDAVKVLLVPVVLLGIRRRLMVAGML